jgi:MFS family permease
MIVPLYQAELVHPDIRGLVTGLQQFMLGVGGVCGAWISYGTYVNYTDDRQWQIPFGIQIIPAALVGGLIFLFPESPRWLISHGKPETGLATLARLHANGDTTDSWVLAEYEQIQSQVTFEKENSVSSFKDLFSVRPNFRRIMLACAIQAATQMTGISAIQYYSVTIFVSIRFSLDCLRCELIVVNRNKLASMVLTLFAIKPSTP